MSARFRGLTHLLPALCLLSCSGGGSSVSESKSSPPVIIVPDPAPGTTTNLAMQAKLWEIGPIINGTNSSSGLPLNPQANPDGFVIQFPQPNASIGHLHYVTALSASLQGKRWIRMKFRIETDPDVKILPTKYPDFPSMLTLYFQREGDDWSGVGKYETYRWWASFKSQTPLIAGNYEIIAPFDQKWTAVQTSDALTNNTAFNDALLHANRVGFTLGGGDGLGHGVYATGNAKIVVTEFVVE